MFLVKLLVFLVIVSYSAAWWWGPSSCKKCKNWYNKDKRDTEWLAKVNREFPCPCRADLDSVPTGWKADWACKKNGRPSCSKYHPGADGCLRSKGTTSTGAGQQCCYDGNGMLLGPDHSGAGTPDRKASKFPWWPHYFADVRTYNWCCLDCPKNCHYYKKLRRGSDSHCR